MGFLLQGGRIVRDEGVLSGKQFLDPDAQPGPVRLRDVEVPSQVEPGALADLGADAFGADEAVGEVDLAVFGCGGFGCGERTWEHDTGGRKRIQPQYNDYGTTFVTSTRNQQLTGFSAQNGENRTRSSGKWVNMG